MAAQAEAITQTTYENSQNQLPANKTREVYARSLRSIRAMGRLGIAGAFESMEYVQAEAEGWGDFYTAIGENLATDPDYGDRLYFNPLETRKIIGGHVVDKFGTPMWRIVDAGYEASLHESQHSEDPEKLAEMPVQVERDYGDTLAVRKVDNLAVGEMLALVSMDPKEAIKRNRDFWEDKMFYREGVAVLQVYYRRSNEELLAGNYSIKQSDVRAVQAILAQEGVAVPAETSCDHYSRYTVHKQMSEAEARMYGDRMLARHQELIGTTSTMRSVTEYIYQKRDYIRQQFNVFMRPLSQAVASGDNNMTMQTLARSLLSRADKMTPDERRMLLRVANSHVFNEDDGRGMEDKIRYAVVEELRKGLPAYLAQAKPASPEPMSAVAVHPEVPAYAATPALESALFAVDPFMVQLLSEQAAQNVRAGQNAGRSYGGCQGAGGNGKQEASNTPANSQTTFGGADMQAPSASTHEASGEDGECEYSGTFCYCCPYAVDGTPLPNPVEITAKRDKNGTAACLRTGCGATLDKNGHGSKGKIYARAMALKAREGDKAA